MVGLQGHSLIASCDISFIMTLLLSTISAKIAIIVANYNALRGDFVGGSGEGLDVEAVDVESCAAEYVEPYDKLG